MTTSAGDKAGPQRPDVFISYSRKDREFVKRLEAALQARGREAWVDWEGIRPAEEFMQAIFPAIEGTDTFIFVISPDSVTSEICGRELAHAAGHNRRMIPIFAREVDVKAIPEALAKLNWVFFCRENDNFDLGTELLISALDTDLGWVRARTRLLTRAIEWEAKGKSTSFVLRGEDLRAAEQWLAQAGTEKERQPTALQTEYIIASRKAAARRQRITLGAVSFGLVVALVLAALAFYQRNLAEERRRLARARELASEASLEFSSREDGLQRSTLLAVESLNSAWTLDGFIACAHAISRLPRRPIIRPAHDGAVLALAFSADGRWLASEDANGKIVIWDTRSQKQITPDTPPRGMFFAALAFSPDGRWLVSASQPAALIWDTATWTMVNELPPTDDQTSDHPEITSAAFNPEGNLLVTATRDSPFVAMYDTATWEENAGWAEAIKAEPRRKGAQVAAFTPNGKWLATGGDGLTVWYTATKKKETRIEKITPWTVAFRADSGMLAVGEMNGLLQLFESPDFQLAEPEPVSVGPADGYAISAIAFSPRGNSLASAGKVARVRNLPQRDGEPKAGQPEIALELPCKAEAIVFSPEGRAVITGNTDGTIATWPLTSGAAVEVLSHTTAVTAVTFDKSGSVLVTASDVLRIFKSDAGSWSVVTERKLPSAASTIGFSPDGRWLVAVLGNKVQLFSTGSWAESPPAIEHARNVVGISFSPDGKWMATRTSRENHRTELVTPSRTQIWDLATRREVAWTTHPDEDYREIHAIPAKAAFKPEVGGDAKLAAMSASWEALRMGRSTSRSSDGRWSVAGGKLSEAQSGREVDLVKHEDAINDAVFRPDGHWLVTASRDRSVRFWPLRSEELRTEAIARLGRNFTYDEWHKFFPDEPYFRTCAVLPVHPSVRDEARELATGGDVNGATALFRQILKAEPTSPFDPAAEARKLADEARRAKESKPENLEQPSPGQTP